MLFESFVGGSYNGSLTVDSERTVNFYPRKVESAGGKAQYVLESTPGYALLCSVGASEIVAAVYGVGGSSNGGNDSISCHVVAYDSTTIRLYQIVQTAGTFSASLVCSWTRQTGLTTYSALLWSGTQFLAIVNGAGYLYTPSTAATVSLTGTGASVGFPAQAVRHAAVADGYFLVASLQASQENQFMVSNLYDGATWSTLNVATARGAGDRVLALASLHRELWVFGRNHAEIYYDAGSVAGTTFPWARNNNAYLEVGCAAPFSLARVADTLVWLGASEGGHGIVYALQGYTPQRVSNHAVESALSKLQPNQELSSVRAYAMQREGHPFYVLCLPSTTSSPGTWVYDLSTGLWHEWLSWTGSAYAPHPLTNGAFVSVVNNNTPYVKQLGWTGADNKVYEVSTASLTDNGNAIKRTRRSPHLVQEQQVLFYHRFTLDCNVGVMADGTAQSGTASLNLSWSDDAGNTWNTPVSVALPAGAYTTRALWRRLGTARDRVFEVTTSSSYNVTLNNAYLDVEAGNS